MTRAQLETQLNDCDPARRRAALEALCDRVARGDIVLPGPRDAVNLHCHTTFSFNGYGYSPSFIAWRARCEGLRVAGCMDFDVLDALDEFLEACRMVGLKGCMGIETRVFVPELADREINSPGEPGIAYHIGVGFTSATPRDPALLETLGATAQRRNQGIMTRVNAYLDPVVLDYERDVLPLTPNGNATERHLCAAYETKARQLLPDTGERAAFWAEKLGGAPARVAALFDDPPAFEGLIRATLMKAGGVAYVQPQGPDFPTLAQVSAFILDMGAIPTYGWVDGLSAAEQAIEDTLDLAAAHGAAALNIIPDRNWNVQDPEFKKTKVGNLYRIVEVAQARDLPIVVGTEMNAYGQRFVDDFDAPELKPLVPAFLEGAYIVYGHTVLEKHAGMGYLSEWAASHFPSTSLKNAFFCQLGERLDPCKTDDLATISPELTPSNVLARI